MPDLASYGMYLLVLALRCPAPCRITLCFEIQHAQFSSVNRL